MNCLKIPVYQNSVKSTYLLPTLVTKTLEITEDQEKIIKNIKENSIKFTYGLLNEESSQIENTIILSVSISHKARIMRYLFLREYYDGKPLVIGLYSYKDYKVIKIINREHSGHVMKNPNKLEHFIILDPSDKISLTEDLPFLNNKTLKIHDLLKNWSSKPSRVIGDKLLKYNLDMYRHCSKTLYRGFNLSPKAKERLSKGKTVRLRKTIFSSWSESEHQAGTFRSEYSIHTGIIFRYMPKNEVVININSFEEHIFNSLAFYPLSREHEVILLNSPEMLVIYPHQIVEGQEVHLNSSNRSN